LNRRRNITCVGSALSEAPGRLGLHVSRGNSGGHSLGTTKYTDSNTVTVDVTTVDAFVERNAIPRLDLLKADVEGAELLVLRGASATLARHRPMLVLECSIHSAGFGYQPIDLARYVESFDYRVLLLDDDGLSPLDGRWPDREFFNIACLPREKADAVATSVAR
jgi:hypothetical protein